jgi:hypothetical protein
MSENTTIWAKNPKVQPNTSIKGPHLSVFPKSDPAKSATDFPNRKSPTDFLRVTCCHAARRDDDLYDDDRDDQARFFFLYINLLR